MRKPRKAVTNDKKNGKEIPLSADDEEDRERNAQSGADKMQQARQRQAVLGNVEIPKF